MVETFRVKGMHCAACASAVERILKKQEGIQDAQVNLVSEQVTVTSDRYLTLEPLVQALGKAGGRTHPEETAGCDRCPGQPGE